jgi:Spy/CpxP family protein refolding chaperone
MKRIVLLALVILALPAWGLGQGNPGEGEDPFARYLFPPDRVIGHAQEIGLDDAQKVAIRNEVGKVQAKFIDTQFELQAEMERIVKLLKEKQVDEAKVLAQVDRILALEKEVKKTQVGLLVRIRNLLTPAQQAKLAQLPKGGGS